MKKVNFGCGKFPIPGWENHDLDIDLRKSLPFESASVDFIFTEHVVEHLFQRDAWNFFEECYRILKPGGVVRTTVPSIAKLHQLMTPEYVRHIKERGWGDGSRKWATKHVVFEHEHQSLWTPDLLIAVQTAIGFVAWEAAPYWSRIPDLHNIENHDGNQWRELNALECVSVEAKK